MLQRRRTLINPLLLAGILLLGSFALTPAIAACGMYVPIEGDAQVAQERALIRWDGKTEDLVMEFELQGASREAAWIVPTPAPATVTLAPSTLFDALQTLTKPRVERRRVFFPEPPMAGGDGGTQGGVAVLERQTLGPFDVSTLAASDATALAGWLTAHGYQLPAGLATALQPYVERQWHYVAVRLTPGVSGAGLSGQLDPLVVSFASDAIIYPLRMAGLAGQPLPVFLYVLAEHRIGNPTTLASESVPLGQGYLDVRYAQWIEPDALESSSPLKEFVDRKRFLTKFEGYLYPGSMLDDWILPLAATDETYHAVEVQYVYTNPLPLVCVGIPLLVLVSIVAVRLVRWGQHMLERRRASVVEAS